ncbi:protein arginine kinase [Haloimpatiens lingqiaonensis]|uniref:protein arginine kinase n=1 Tax=Haloimpatiens lingqiaonensis TaxID=1380675 RepID=UPI0010FCF25A|nr:protein arginine kinase [Haloimpatiens lingqiaonensis]
MENWVKAKNEMEDIVLSSRIRLARNLQGIPFPDKLDIPNGKDLVNKIEENFYSVYSQEDYKTIYLWSNDRVSNSVYLEKHLISPKLLNNTHKGAFICDKEQTVSIMMNEEDHLRIQCITAGLNLKEAYETANILDNKLEENMQFAFDEKLGYLTACPTNLGTGLRASVMLHLPALVMEKEIEQVFTAISHLGMTIRGLYGEGSRSEGNLFQVSNQVTLGVSEQEIITNLIAVVKQIINQENIARERILKKYNYEIQDKIYRALGILRSAILLENSECLKLLSYVRMGVETGIIKDIEKNTLNELLIYSQPASLQKNSKETLSKKQRDMQRAILIKSKL